jgi:YidC/Oxa1 family membrane protein insertase
VNKRVRILLLVTLLLVAVTVLTSCGLPQGDVDRSDPNAGPWNRFLVYPLVEFLIIINSFIEGLGIPYSWGWSIILLTLLLKIVTLPLTRKQLQSTKATQEMQPKLAELQAKYGKDRQKMAEEQMKLYKEAGVNPMGGCLPLLIQMPILFALYQALYILAATPEFADASFFWIPDLAFPTQQIGTSWISDFYRTNQWLLLFAYFSLPVLMLVSQIVMQKMTQPAKDRSGNKTQAQGQTQMMNSMMMFMPIMFGYITLGLPAGLTLYWTTSNILSLIQQYFVAGWGGLVDWLPMLRKQPKSGVTAASTPASAPVTSVSTTTAANAVLPGDVSAPKPEKRRRRKK